MSIHLPPSIYHEMLTYTSISGASLRRDTLSFSIMDQIRGRGGSEMRFACVFIHVCTNDFKMSLRGVI